MFELTVKNRFAAAHQLKMVSQKCENLHGHNWEVEVCLAGESLDSAGVLMDFGEIKHMVADIMADLDHKFLNELECFPDQNPSSEHIAVYIAERMTGKVKNPGVSVRRVTVWESPGSGAAYIPPE
ncbi:6-carboxy-5,6,7,8-tetrahydropterin synthase [Candidatus Desulfarcum epimagneticum]|uniref:6-carboxy-5,6,7,8-tetrahydropterin synthase n=1 Tax=uncultured Desulfobacteraceae bacterium TaxID=218296 RepID=A0A484HG61_9BACT|nr:6-carboxy-5,6,7,8-tetrahydropterin synthase [uncultured Desulfobacteraceae bacterium]